MTQADRGDELSPRSTRRRLSERAWRRILWWGGAIIFSTMVWLADKDSNPLTQSPVLMVGTVIVGYARMMVALATGCLGLWAACLLLWLRDIGSLMAGRPTPRRSGLRRTVRILGSASAGTVGMVAMVVCLFVFMATGPDARMPFRILDPPSGSGCRIIIWKQAVDPAYGSEVSVYVKRPGSVLVRDTGIGWRVTGSQPPMAAGAWSMSWDKDRAHLAVSTRARDGQRDIRATVSC